MPVFRDCSQTNRTAENGLLGSEGGTVLVFLRRAYAQSGFKQSIRRMQCITSRGFGRSRLTLVRTLEIAFGSSYQGVSNHPEGALNTTRLFLRGAIPAYQRLKSVTCAERLLAARIMVDILSTILNIGRA
jgi:hypothetical protein